MIQIDDKIVSLDILREKFCCDITACKGICCVEGSSGAPMDADEGERFEEEYPNYEKWLTEEGRQAIAQQGFMVLDVDNDLTTPLINNEQCAYSFTENGITLCAVERAFLEGVSKFRKPASCHLYPIRVAKFKNGTLGLNYHCWNVCNPALKLGKKLETPLYVSLKAPITEYFGEDFYRQLEEVAANLKQMNYER